MFSKVPRAVGRWFPFNRLDRICLAFGISVLVPFSILWIFLVAAAGTAPMGRLTGVCVTWAAETEMLVVVPIWLTARLVYSLYEIMSRSQALHR
jgi:hypothetical protein